MLRTSSALLGFALLATPGRLASAQRAIDSLEILAGSLPDRAVRLVREWAELHRAELAENWMRARDGQPLERIAPLP